MDLHQGRGFIEGRTSYTKTSNSTRKRNRFLAMAAPSHGLLDTPWAESWLAVRLALGLEVGRDKAFMPAIRPNGSGFYKTPMTASDGTKFLRQLLLKYGGFDWADLLRIGSHSCKSCVLSWMAKFGADLCIRRLLGYHAGPQDTSVLTYSRDAMSEPLRQMQKVLDSVSTGVFMPDSTRSGRFSKDLAVNQDVRDGPGEEGGDEVEVRPVKRFREENFNLVAVDSPSHCELCGSIIDDAVTLTVCDNCGRTGCSHCVPLFQVDEDSICSVCFNRDWVYPDDVYPAESQVISDDVSDGFGPALPSELSNFTTEDEVTEDDSGEDPLDIPDDDREILEAASFIAEAEVGSRVRAASKSAGQSLYRHRIYKTLHLERIDDATKLACGRDLSGLYNQLDCMPAFPFPKCFTCFGRA